MTADNSASREAEPDRLAALFLATAQATPDRAAVRDRTSAWTYAEVAAAASALADQLEEQGVAPGDRVGVIATRQAGGPVAILAALWCGATYVPIDPTWPAARRAAVLAGAQVRLALLVDCDHDTPDGVARLELTTGQLLAGRPGPLTAPRPRPDPGAALVIFTSGSTGAPKGVELRSAAAAGVVSAVAATIGMGSDSVFVAIASFAFDVSVFEIFAPWSVGGELVIAAELQILANELDSLLVAPGRLAFLQSTPTVLKSLLHAGLELPAGIVLMLAGERLRRSLVARLGHLRQIWNMYGPTETTIYASMHACLPLPVPDTAEDLPIGMPVNGARFELRPAAATGSADEPGTDSGELLIGGPGVALGYLGRPDLTTERFLDGGAWYTTGDLVRRRDDGLLQYLGRVDRQVKIRGNRVELDEVELVLADLVGHGRVAVRTDEHDTLGRHLAAFVADPQVDLRHLRRRFAERLPAYMVPTRIYLVAEIPTTSSGKTNYLALQAPDPAVS